MNEGAGADALRIALAELPAHEVLSVVVDALIAQDPVELPGSVALERVRSVSADIGRVQVAVLAGIHDVERRELFTLDAAGSTRGWLRRLPGGEDGQLTRARQWAAHPHVPAAVADGSVSPRGAAAVCSGLEAVPHDLDDATTTAFLLDGVGEVLAEATGAGISTTDAAVLATCVSGTSLAPAERVEPALVLLARRLTPTLLGRALGHLTEAIRPTDTTDPSQQHHYHLQLRPLLDGDWDLRGVLDPETGHLLAQEIQRRERATEAHGAGDDTDAAERENRDGADEADNDGADNDRIDGDGAQVLDLGLPDPTADVRDAAAPGRKVESDPVCTDHTNTVGERVSARGCQVCGPQRLVVASRRRHDALTHLLRDTTSRGLHHGRAAPTALTVTTTIGALTGQPGAPPALLHHPGRKPIPLPTETTRRLACDSELTAVLLDAERTPVGASHTARSATPRERRALRSRWGPHCAVHGCANTATVPHHVIPFHLSKETVLRDLVPLCGPCHHDIHEGHRTLRLRSRNHIDHHGWADSPAAHAA